MITMYASVANRTAEIGTLRALGFRRASILGAFLLESLLLGLFGRRYWVSCSLRSCSVSVSTDQLPDLFRDCLRFTLTRRIVVQSLLFAAVMGCSAGSCPQRGRRG